MEYCLEDLRSKYFQWEKKEVFWVKWGPNEDLFYSFWGLWVVISKMRTISAIVRTSPVPYFSEWLWTSEIWARYSLSELLNKRDILWTNFLMSEILYSLDESILRRTFEICMLNCWKCIFVYDVNNLGSMCHFKIYVDIGYIMPTLWGRM